MKTLSKCALFLFTSTVLFGCASNGFLNDSIFSSKNSFERLLGVLSNPLEAQAQKRKIGLMLAMHQQQFGTPSTDNDSIDELLNNPLKIINNSLMAKDRTNGNFYLLPEVYIADDFAKTKVAVKISDLSVKSTVSVDNIQKTLDKKTWEMFWQLYNLIQQNVIIIEY